MVKNGLHVEEKRQRPSLLFEGKNLFKSLQNRMNSSFSSNHPGAIHPILQFALVQNSKRGKELNKLRSPNSCNDLCLFFCIYPSSMGLHNNSRDTDSLLFRYCIAVEACILAELQPDLYPAGTCKSKADFHYLVLQHIPK